MEEETECQGAGKSIENLKEQYNISKKIFVGNISYRVKKNMLTYAYIYI